MCVRPHTNNRPHYQRTWRLKGRPNEGKTKRSPLSGKMVALVRRDRHDSVPNDEHYHNLHTSTSRCMSSVRRSESHGFT